jgi:hypothetical protein
MKKRQKVAAGGFTCDEINGLLVKIRDKKYGSEGSRTSEQEGSEVEVKGKAVDKGIYGYASLWCECSGGDCIGVRLKVVRVENVNKSDQVAHTETKALRISVGRGQ